MKAHKTKIAIVVGVLALLLGAVAAAYAYDSTQKDTIAEGVTIGGVDVGGLEAGEAKRVVRKALIAPLRHSLVVTYEGRSWKLSGNQLKVHTDLDGAIAEALAASRDGGLPTRIARYVTGGEVDESIAADVTYSRPALNRFVLRVAEDLYVAPQDATVDASGETLEVVPASDGRKLRDNLLTEQLEAAVLNADAPHTIAARTNEISPAVTASEVSTQYPTYLTLDRESYTLRFWRSLKLAKTYTVAVGQVGLETPAGLYHIQNKQVDPTWHVPNSDWAGDLAGQSIPPGPSNPLKARWMGIFSGAGIHGTDVTSSLGTAASHGCVRMAIPDVIELYDEIDVGTPIYID